MKMSIADISKEFNVKRSSKDWQWIRLKLRWVHLLSLKGMKCKTCGEDDIICLEFHHRDPSEKENQISYLNMGYGTKKGEDSFLKAKEEIDKCDLLCRNCHYEIHAVNASYSQRKFLKIANKDRCEECGYSKLRVLDFHHLHGKDFALSRSNHNTENEIRNEIGKCKVLCKNCHKKVHKDMTKWKYIDRVKELALKYDEFSRKTVSEILEEKVEIIKELYSKGNSFTSICKKLGISVGFSGDIGSIIHSKIDIGDLRPTWADCIKRSGGKRELLYPKINSFIEVLESGRRVSHKLIHELFGLESKEVKNLKYQLRSVGINFESKKPISVELIIEKWNDTSLMYRRDVASSLGITPKSLSMRISMFRKKYPELVIIKRFAEPRVSPWNKGSVKELGEIDKKIIELRSKGLTAKEMSKVLGVTDTSIRLRCSKMIKMGIMERIPKQLSNSWNIENWLKKKGYGILPS